MPYSYKLITIVYSFMLDITEKASISEHILLSMLLIPQKEHWYIVLWGINKQLGRYLHSIHLQPVLTILMYA